MVSIDNGTTALSVYNALGQRVDQTGSGVHFAYLFHADGSELAIWRVAVSVWGDRYINFSGQPIAKYTDTGGTLFLHTNLLGSTLMVTDHTTAVGEKKLFYPYGQQWRLAGTNLTIRFASLREGLPGSGDLMSQSATRDYPSRFYRWMSPDPLAGSISNPQSLNRYAYVLNNPTNLTDPLGLGDCDTYTWYHGRGRCMIGSNGFMG